jgi:hypothetical protein
MAGRKGLKTLLILIIALTALGWKAPAQDINSFSVGSFHSPKGLGICLENQQEQEYFDSFNLISDFFGILRGEYTKPGIKATYYRNIVLKHYDKEDFSADLYAGPGVTAGYVRDIHEPFSAVAGMAGVAGGRLYFDKKRVVVCLEAGLDLALELNRNNRYKNTNLTVYKSGIYHAFYPQIRILYRIK